MKYKNSLHLNTKHNIQIYFEYDSPKQRYMFKIRFTGISHFDAYFKIHIFVITLMYFIYTEIMQIKWINV